MHVFLVNYISGGAIAPGEIRSPPLAMVLPPEKMLTCFPINTTKGTIRSYFPPIMQFLLLSA